MRTIQIQVSDDVAEKYENLSAVEKEEIARLLSVWAKKSRSILEVMSDISEYAKKQGLTPEILEKLLEDE